MSTHARPLAAWLASASDAELEQLFFARGINPDVDWQDFFDAAEALLDPVALGKLLPRLTRAEAAALVRAIDGSDAEPASDDAEQKAVLIALALLRPDGTPQPPVVAAAAGRPLPADTPHLPALTADADPAAVALAAERAFTTVAALADLLLLTRGASLGLLASGNVSAGEKRQLGESGIASDTVDDLLAIALAADLVRIDNRRLRLTAKADSWLRASAGDRWVVLATGYRASLPRGLRDGAGWLAPDAWADAHPWDPAWPAYSVVLRDRARLLGLITASDTQPAWALAFQDDGPIDGTVLQQMLPAEVDKIFLQNDLSAIAPGPLAPGLDVRLRDIAVRESAAQASSYRFSAGSIAHALVSGESEESIVAFLEELSLTGIPQPLRYLISQTAQRHGLVQVSADLATGRTRIGSEDAHLLGAMLVDQVLRPLALTKETGALTSRVGRETVYWALTDARYPATLVGAGGEALPADRHPVTSEPAPPVAISHTALIERLRAQQGPDADAAWLDRELDAAVKAKAVLLVSVGMPDGSTRELVLEASGLGGGRLRGRDRAADVERTLPVSSIRSAKIIDPETGAV